MTKDLPPTPIPHKPDVKNWEHLGDIAARIIAAAKNKGAGE